MTLGTVVARDDSNRAADSPAVGRSLLFAPTAIVVLFAALPVLAAFREPLTTLDEGLLLVYPEQILAGDVPNRDFFTSYGPGGLSLLAAVFAVVGPSVLAERAVGLAYHVGVSTGVFAMTRRLGAFPATVAGVLAGLLMMPLGLGAYVWLGALAFVTWSLAVLDHSSTWRSALSAGVLGALAICWRPEMAVVVIISSLPHLWRSGRWRPWGAGVVIGAVPLALHASLGGWRLWGNITARAGANGNLRISISDIDVIIGAGTTLFATGYLIWCAVRYRSPWAISWALASVLVLPQMLQRLERGHVLAIACLILPLAVARHVSRADSVPRFVKHFGPGPAERIAWVASALLLVPLTAQALMASTGSRPTVTHQSRSLPVLHPEEKQAIDKLLRQVDATVPVDARVFMGARDMSVPTINDIRLYHLLPDLDAFAYNLELPPPRARGSALLADLREADALVLLDVPRSWGLRLVPFIPPGDDAANDLVADRFCHAETVHPYEIFLRCRPGQ